MSSSSEGPVMNPVSPRRETLSERMSRTRRLRNATTGGGGSVSTASTHSSSSSSPKEYNNSGTSADGSLRKKKDALEKRARAMNRFKHTSKNVGARGQSPTRSEQATSPRESESSLSPTTSAASKSPIRSFVPSRPAGGTANKEEAVAHAAGTNRFVKQSQQQQAVLHPPPPPPPPPNQLSPSRESVEVVLQPPPPPSLQPQASSASLRPRGLSLSHERFRSATHRMRNMKSPKHHNHNSSNAVVDEKKTDDVKQVQEEMRALEGHQPMVPKKWQPTKAAESSSVVAWPDAALPVPPWKQESQQKQQESQPEEATKDEKVQEEPAGLPVPPWKQQSAVVVPPPKWQKPETKKWQRPSEKSSSEPVVGEPAPAKPIAASNNNKWQRPVEQRPVEQRPVEQRPVEQPSDPVVPKKWQKPQRSPPPVQKTAAPEPKSDPVVPKKWQKPVPPKPTSPPKWQKPAASRVVAVPWPEEEEEADDDVSPVEPHVSPVVPEPVPPPPPPSDASSRLSVSNMAARFGGSPAPKAPSSKSPPRQMPGEPNPFDEGGGGSNAAVLIETPDRINVLDMKARFNAARSTAPTVLPSPGLSQRKTVQAPSPARPWNPRTTTTEEPETPDRVGVGRSHQDPPKSQQPRAEPAWRKHQTPPPPAWAKKTQDLDLQPSKSDERNEESAQGRVNTKSMQPDGGAPSWAKKNTDAVADLQQASSTETRESQRMSVAEKRGMFGKSADTPSRRPPPVHRGGRVETPVWLKKTNAPVEDEGELHPAESSESRESHGATIETPAKIKVSNMKEMFGKPMTSNTPPRSTRMFPRTDVSTPHGPSPPTRGGVARTYSAHSHTNTTPTQTPSRGVSRSLSSHQPRSSPTGLPSPKRSVAGSFSSSRVESAYAKKPQSFVARSQSPSPAQRRGEPPPWVKQDPEPPPPPQEEAPAASPPSMRSSPWKNTTKAASTGIAERWNGMQASTEPKVEPKEEVPEPTEPKKTEKPALFLGSMPTAKPAPAVRAPELRLGSMPSLPSARSAPAAKNSEFTIVQSDDKPKLPPKSPKNPRINRLAELASLDLAEESSPRLRPSKIPSFSPSSGLTLADGKKLLISTDIEPMPQYMAEDSQSDAEVAKINVEEEQAEREQAEETETVQAVAYTARSPSPSRNRPWKQDAETLSPMRWQNQVVSAIAETEGRMETPTRGNLSPRSPYDRQPRLSRDGHGEEEKKASAEDETRFKSSPMSLSQMAVDSIHAVDFEQAMRGMAKRSASSEDDTDGDSGGGGGATIPRDLPPEFARVLGVYSDDSGVPASATNIVDQLEQEGGDSGSYNSEEEQRRYERNRNISDHDEQEPVRNEKGLVFGVPETFGAAGSDADTQLPSVVDRAKALHSWKGGLGVAPKVEKSRNVAAEIGSPVRKSGSRDVVFGDPDTYGAAADEGKAYRPPVKQRAEATEEWTGSRESTPVNKTKETDERPGQGQGASSILRFWASANDDDNGGDDTETWKDRDPDLEQAGIPDDDDDDYEEDDDRKEDDSWGNARSEIDAPPIMPALSASVFPSSLTDQLLPLSPSSIPPKEDRVLYSRYMANNASPRVPTLRQPDRDEKPIYASAASPRVPTLRQPDRDEKPIYASRQAPDPFALDQNALSSLKTSSSNSPKKKSKRRAFDPFWDGDIKATTEGKASDDLFAASAFPSFAPQAINESLEHERRRVSSLEHMTSSPFEV